MSVRKEVIALERLLARRKQLCSLLISLDGYSRWGGGSDEDWANEAAKEAAQHPQVTAKLQQKIDELKANHPEAIVEWADAHIAVLDDYLNRVAEDSTEAFVASEERGQWLQVRAGKLDFVEENPVYVRPDHRVYQRLFGFYHPPGS